ncbi:hypothetical protein ONZ43_g3034 [Nemania bipapillata]|uniref:Uncharacterized protein n=1 Tax=Nemania bipapillata TaxID=110536 RepID=A0ACC2IYG9_9PEZI|nr:hypothetical protein ONZ43_g3034 [Nemania bipapillata]
MNSTGTPNHAGHDDSTDNANAALRGAFLAFQKTAAKPAPNGPSMPTPTLTPMPTPTRDATNGHDNGALMAATSASRDHSLSRSPSRPAIATGQSNNALTPVKSPSADPRSPSLIAATLAASRSGSPSPKTTPSMHTGTHQAAKERRKGNIGEDSNAVLTNLPADLDLTTDSGPIAPTNALISLFEQKGGETDPVKKSPAVSSVKKGLKAGLRPMTPPRAMSPVIAVYILYQAYEKAAADHATSEGNWPGEHGDSITTAKTDVGS